MSGPVPFSAVENILTTLRTSGFQEFGFLFEGRKMLEENLATIKDVLVDAEEKRGKSHIVEAWVRRLTDVLYDVEDVLDELATHQLQRRVVARQVSGFFSSSNQIAFPFKMSHRLKDIAKVVDKIVKEIDELRFIQRNITHSHREVESSRATHSLVSASEIVGREEDKEEIINSLVSTDSQEILSMVAIVGCGGLGKTTLAQLVYNDKRVVQSFELRIWVCVSVNFHVEPLVKEILKVVCDEDVEMLEWNGLKNLFHEELSQKRCLFVLDDVRNENPEKWHQLKSLLMVVGKGSKILVTTRSEMVVSIMAIDSRFCLKELQKIQAWDLFSRIAFTEKPEKAHPHLVELGNTIVNICRGSPLLIKISGAVLRLKTEESQWPSLRSLWFRSLGDRLRNLWFHALGDLYVISVLRFSYDDLPIHLKQCFAFCALFPENYKIDKKLLVQLWMAQGYIESSDSKFHLEDVGNQYFEDLLSRSLFEEVIEGVNDNIKRYKMHDLVHDLAQAVMGPRAKILTDEMEDIPGGVNHVSLFGFSGTLSPIICASMAKSLRTCLVFTCHDCKYEPVMDTWISSLKCLRALDLKKMLGVKRVPKCLGKLIHLRFLDLSYNDFTVLPNAITRLKNLQTLKLVHCRNLKKFPKNTRELINLRHLENDRCLNLTYMPFGIGDLTLLQSLSIFVVGNGRGHSQEKKIGSLIELKRLNNLRGELHIINLENVRDGALDTKEGSLKGKQYLKSLSLEWGSSEQEAKDDELVIESLQPHPNLKKLYVKGYGGGRFPGWLMSDELCLLLPNLLHIRLEGCKRSQFLPSFAQLPFLRSLEFTGLDEVKYVMDYSSEIPFFPSLERLQLNYLCKLSRFWRTELPAEQRPLFPCLFQLVIEYCDCLTSLTLPSLPCLSELEITCCDNLTSLPLPPLPCLSKLHISQCPNLASLELHSSPHLYYLCIKVCPYLTSLKLPLLPHLEVLDLCRVREEVWQQLMFVSSSLKSLSIWQLYKTR